MNILCLQETHLAPRGLTTLKNDINVKFFLSGRLTNAMGVCTIINSNFEYILHKTHSDPEGRFIILDLELPGIMKFSLINLYAPNEDNPDFFINLTNLVNSFENKNQVWTGDWNVPLNMDDTYNYRHIRNKQSKY